MPNKLPKHLAIIPDGNRRWAKNHNLPSFEGHRRGFDTAIKIARAARKLGIHTLTLWGFSTENWNRSGRERQYLFELFIKMTDKYLKEAKKDEVKIIHLGRKDRLPEKLIKKITKAESQTKDNKQYVLNLAIDYGGQDEIIRATKKYCQYLKTNLSAQKQTFPDFLDTANQPHPYPDLIIRTSGEKRLSGFLLWQSSYSELYFEKNHFPDFTSQKLEKAVKEYGNRKRRFGGN
jgi:undecaprenyl diphosphate synthase